MTDIEYACVQGVYAEPFHHVFVQSTIRHLSTVLPEAGYIAKPHVT